MRLEDRPTVQVEIEIAAPRELVWSLVVDPTRMGEFSPENLGGAWEEPWTGPAVGARFVARNRRAGLEWETTSTVVQCEPNRVFAFVVGDPENPAATWRYQFHPRRAEGVRIAESVELGPGPSGLTARIAMVPDKEEEVVAARAAEHASHMAATLTALKAAAEGHPGA